MTYKERDFLVALSCAYLLTPKNSKSETVIGAWLEMETDIIRPTVDESKEIADRAKAYTGIGI